jgi:hypothetical protein
LRTKCISLCNRRRCIARPGPKPIKNAAQCWEVWINLPASQESNFTSLIRICSLPLLPIDHHTLRVEAKISRRNLRPLIISRSLFAEFNHKLVLKSLKIWKLVDSTRQRLFSTRLLPNNHLCSRPENLITNHVMKQAPKLSLTIQKLTATRTGPTAD